jgi:protoporphyrinogen oxidase
MKIGIIGAGALGLTAAYELTKLGHQADIFERASFIGGQASTFDIGDGRLERGYHHLFRSDVDIVNLINEIGLGDRLQWIESKVGLFHGGKIWDFGSPKDLLSFGGLKFLDRLRLGLVTFYLQKTNNLSSFEGVTAKEWLERKVGKKPYQVIWEPMLKGKFGRYYDQVSMAWIWNKIHLRVASRERLWDKEKLGYPMGSFGEIFDVLGEKIREQGGNVYLSTGVNKILVENNKAIGLELDIKGKGIITKKYDAIIATTPSYVFGRLVPNLPKSFLSTLNKSNYLAAVLIILVLDRALTNKYWLNIADRDIPFVGVIEHTNFVDSSVYGGNHIVYITNYPSVNDPIYRMNGEDLLETYLPYLGQLNAKFDRAWIKNYFHYRVEAAQPIIGVNYRDTIPSHHTPVENLYLANTTQIYPEDRGTNYSVQLGRKIASIVLKDRTM